jgi:hypothetical protein
METMSAAGVLLVAVCVALLVVFVVVDKGRPTIEPRVPDWCYRSAAVMACLGSAASVLGALAMLWRWATA